jgi:IS30 family transposase
MTQEAEACIMGVARQPHTGEGKMSHYTHLTIEEREKAMVLHKQGMKNNEIARELGRSPSTISREMKRNMGSDGYSAIEAQRKYKQRRKRSRRRLIFSNEAAANYVKERLNQQWSPEQIAGRAKTEKYAISFSYGTIYRAVANRILPISLHKQMRIKSKHRSRKTDDKRGKVLDCLTIHDRPKTVEKRGRIGHWESDSVIGKRGTGCIGTHVERKTGFLIAFRMDDRKGDAFNVGTIKAFEDIPKKYRKSFTVDRGAEFYKHKLLAEGLGAKVYFCDPYHPWQRGTNENTNGLLRQYFPKGSSFADITHDSLQLVVDRLNNRPRKRLGYRSPAEVFLKNCCT